MRGSVPLGDIEEIPYVKNVPRDGRVLHGSFYDRNTNEWILFYPAGEKLFRIMPAVPVIGFYWGQEPEDPKKIFIFLYAHLYFSTYRGLALSEQ